MIFFKKHKISILLFLLFYLLLFGMYYMFAVGIPDKTFYLQSRRYIPCALVMTIATMLWNKCGFELKGLVPPGIVFLFWALSFPVTDWLSIHKSVTFLDNHYDMAFAAYVYAAIVCFRIALYRSSSEAVEYAKRFVFSLVNVVFMIIPLLELAYYQYYGVSITSAACMAAIQTNKNEATEFVMQALGISGILGILAVFLAIFVCFFYFNAISKLRDNEVASVIDGKDEGGNRIAFLDRILRRFTDILPDAKVLFGAIVIAIVSVSYSAKIFKDTGVMEKYFSAKSYFAAADTFRKYHEKNYAELFVYPTKPEFSKPSTIVMLIGESATRSYMSAYNPKMKNDNTPWMRKMCTDDPENFLLFKHGYASWGQTVPSLERALTEKNQYNDKEFSKSLTVIDIAKKAGYDTYWFSGQGTISDADTPITLVAETADHAEWLEETQAHRTTRIYDGELLDLLKKVDPTKNNFIVFHVMGSHDRYFNRYPTEFTKFGDKNPEDYLTTYDNSLAYTDWILEEIYKYGKEKLNLQAMMYFSDHGVNPSGKRLADSAPFVALRIPFFIYLSDEYERKFPKTTATLKSHLNSYYTNDLTYDTICGLLNIKSNHYDETNSIASDKYKFNRNNLTTRLGKSKLTEDTNEEK